MEILDDRIGTRATLVTSQLPVEHWNAWIGDPAMADVMLDRLLPQAHRLVLKGESLRSRRSPGTAGHDHRNHCSRSTGIPRCVFQ